MCNNEQELYHFGVKGMRWGHRKVRGHAGPGKYATRKRQLEGDKRDLQTLNNGGHLSVGLTKKRQAAYDKRDKAVLEKRIDKNEARIAKNEQKNNKGLSTKQKKVLKVGAAVAGTALATYGGYKMHEFIRDKNVDIRVAQGKKLANLEIARLDRSKTWAWESSKNEAHRKILMEYRNESADMARNDSFRTATKNVYKYYKNRKR